MDEAPKSTLERATSLVTHGSGLKLRRQSFGKPNVLCRGCIALMGNNQNADVLIEHHPLVVDLEGKITEWERKAQQWELSRNLLLGKLRMKKDTLAYIRGTLYKEILQLKEHLFMYQSQTVPELANDFTFFDINRLMEGNENSEHEEFEKLASLLRSEHNAEKDRLRSSYELQVSDKVQIIHDLERSISTYGAKLQEKDAKRHELEAEFQKYKAASVHATAALNATHATELEELHTSHCSVVDELQIQAKTQRVDIQERDLTIDGLHRSLETERSKSEERASLLQSIAELKVENIKNLKEQSEAHAQSTKDLTAMIEKLTAANEQQTDELSVSTRETAKLQTEVQKLEALLQAAEQLQAQKAPATQFWKSASAAKQEMNLDQILDTEIERDEALAEVARCNMKCEELRTAEAERATEVVFLERDISALQQQVSILIKKNEEETATLTAKAATLEHELDMKNKREKLFTHYTETAVDVVDKMDALVNDAKADKGKKWKHLSLIESTLGNIKSVQRQLKLKFEQSGLKTVQLSDPHAKGRDELVIRLNTPVPRIPVDISDSEEEPDCQDIVHTTDAACQASFTIPHGPAATVGKQTQTPPMVETPHDLSGPPSEEMNSSVSTPRLHVPRTPVVFSSPVVHKLSMSASYGMVGKEAVVADNVSLSNFDAHQLYRGNRQPTFSQLTPPPSKPVAELLLALATLGSPEEIARRFHKDNCAARQMKLRPLTPSPFDERDDGLLAAVDKQWGAGEGVWSTLEKETADMTVWELLESRIYSLLEYIAQRKVTEPSEEGDIAGEKEHDRRSTAVAHSYLFDCGIAAKDVVFTEPQKAAQFEKGRAGGSVPTHRQRRGKATAPVPPSQQEASFVVEGQCLETNSYDEAVRHFSESVEPPKTQQHTYSEFRMLKMKQLERLHHLVATHPPPTLTLTSVHKEPVEKAHVEKLIFNPLEVDTDPIKRGFSTPKVLKAMPHSHKIAMYNHLPRPGSAPAFRKT